MIPALTEDFVVIGETLGLLLQEVAAAEKRCETRLDELRKEHQQCLERISHDLLPDLRRASFRRLAASYPITKGFSMQYGLMRSAGRRSVFDPIFKRREYRRWKEHALDMLRNELMVIMQAMRPRPRSLAKISDIGLDIEENHVLCKRLKIRQEDLDAQRTRLAQLRGFGDEILAEEAAMIADAAQRARICRSQPIVPELLPQDNDNFTILQTDSA
ncbi:hypothetical protein A2765_04085 [Candidatus Kaiserbacteria bacterium RIFCSPHIGHO2_01_FULL_56_24]|uniref:Uncharacterized protein n=1 Tax=Candidatus Kaiserbacteria bacterium RIFCSPHIGHO2_01_FULL_56_24 TaxID=1798487 RepID=A0A1F6DEJ6_9BACT|nr:MAG: hypothetical protein A2765_04085 [Candidatus Kaiserbacteria bacterium RIFCSPHIGHO2_01_FULL_56_24]